MDRRLLCVALAGVALVGVGACGDDDDDTSTSSMTTTSTAAESTTATTAVDDAAVDADLLAQFQATQPGIQEVEVSREGDKLELRFGVGESGDTPDDPSGFAMLAVEALQKDHPAVLDGVQDVSVHIAGPAGESSELYPLDEVQAWIQDSGGMVDY